jgi:hypothetical protein
MDFCVSVLYNQYAKQQTQLFKGPSKFTSAEDRLAVIKLITPTLSLPLQPKQFDLQLITERRQTTLLAMYKNAFT